METKTERTELRHRIALFLEQPLAFRTSLFVRPQSYVAFPFSSLYRRTIS
jgi:hypothetical protein